MEGTIIPDPDPAPMFMPYRGEDIARMRIEATTLGDLLLSAADRFPESSALVFSKEQRTYAQLATASLRRARGLQALGVRPRDHVGILLPTNADFVSILFAVAMCGAVAVLINARYKPSELAYVIENADVSVLVTTDVVAEHVNFIERLNGAFGDLRAQTDSLALSLVRAPRLKNIVLLGDTAAGGFVSARQFAGLCETGSETAVHLARVAVRLRDIAMMLYTSGTSSNPKGCLITHEAIVRNAINLGRNRWRFTHDDRVWSPLPLFHIAAMLPLLSIFDAGGAYIGMEYFEPGLALAMIREHGATSIFSPFVTFLQALLYHPDFKKTDLSKIGVMNSCFAVMPPAVGSAFKEAMPDSIQVGTFGMTEASGIVSTGCLDMDRELGFSRLGLPLVGLEVRIVDRETGQELPRGAQGEVLIRGYSLFEGYYRDMEKSAEVLDRDGWYHSGDIGSIDEHGHIMFHGRSKDMLKVGGENVAAAEVEAVLAGHPAVRLAQVVGIPDSRLAEVPAAFVELVPGTSVGAEELIDLCRREMATFKVPRLIRFVSEWPMSASKIQKFRLRETLIKEFGPD